MPSNTAALTRHVEQAQAGNKSAFAEIVQRTQNLVTSVALAIVHDVKASEDIAQEAYILAWQKINQLKQAQSFLPWLRQTTRHCAYQWLEKEKHNHRQRQQSLDAELEQLISTEQPDEAFTQQQRQQIIAQALTRLPDDSRDIVLLYYREQQSSEHVAELLGIDSATVRKRLSRARKALAEDLLGRVGKAALLSAPSLSVTTILSTALTLGSPPAAAAGLSATGALSSGIKWIAVLGIAAVGILGGLAGLFIGSRQAQKYAPTAEARQQLVRLRNHAAVFLIAIGGLFFASYELDPGWILPLATYSLLVSGIMYYQVQVQRHVNNPKSKRWSCYLGAILGFGGGGISFIAGLIMSGRL
ncbi:sigma-70 family RNA polymerase sigma factor [Idiomarina sp. HP20-50]|uniref:RNA polymerase sigma factor n=1 Tax=Idiomarina sp. HP20-50 TaxID=3070813 RepID=UPI00294B892C|nr:sigma-70 family RNA polymerase sigma factor [Idiomarina sp. HP20-50]MDV6316678.1 sigma-70 family RNA polymerase sigma factor [Idiomarina sp. HP20-50]